MEKKRIRWRVIAAVFGLVLILTCGFADAAPRNGRGNGAADGTVAVPQVSQKEKMRLQAQATHVEVKALLTEILTAANKNQPAPEQTVKKALLSLEKNKQNALAYDEIQRADYMLLQAWTAFAQGNLPEAMNWSMRACRQDEASQDAWISQALFSMLSGKRPSEPKIKKPELQQTDSLRQRPERIRPQPRRVNEAAAPVVYDPEPYTTKGTLEFDILTLRTEFFREKFERLECRTAAAKAFEYIPGKDTMCVLLWQSTDASVVSDVNEPGSPAVIPAEMGYDISESVATPLEAQRRYFSNLIEACKDTQTIKFIQVDTVKPRNLSSVDMQSYNKMAVPTLVAAHPDSNAKRFACDASTPFMMIVDQSGSVKYSGPATGFMPAFILTALTQKPISLEPTVQTDSQASYMGYPEMDFMQMEGMPATPAVKDPNAPDPNKPQPIAVAPAAPTITQMMKPEEQLSGEDLQKAVEAEKLLQLAQLEIEGSIKIRGKNPEEGINACREVLKKYPNTPYAEQAKVLLRRVPDRYKERFQITDEELM